MTVLLGRSGSGKTTLLRTVNRIGCAYGWGSVRDGKPNRDEDLIALRRSMRLCDPGDGAVSAFNCSNATLGWLLGGRGVRTR